MKVEPFGPADDPRLPIRRRAIERRLGQAKPPDPDCDHVGEAIAALALIGWALLAVAVCLYAIAKLGLVW